MKMKQSLLALGNRSESGATAEGTHLLGSERQMHEGNGKTELPPSAQIGIPAKPRILIVTDDDSISIRLKVILRREGLFRYGGRVLAKPPRLGMAVRCCHYCNTGFGRDGKCVEG